MKKYLLDTNICIFLMKGRRDVGDRLHAIGVSNCFISEITKAELLYGAYNSKRNKEKELALVERLLSLFTIIPISEVIPVYARQKARLRRAGTPVDDLDLFIGSTAITYGYTMVTENVRHFELQEGIELENWVRR